MLYRLKNITSFEGKDFYAFIRQDYLVLIISFKLVTPFQEKAGLFLS